MNINAESMEKASTIAKGHLADSIEEKGVSVTTIKELFKVTIQED